MALLVNWFEVTFDRKTFSLPSVVVSSPEESHDLLEKYRGAQIGLTRTDSEMRAYFVTGSPVEQFQMEEVSVFGPRSVLSRAVEFNLAQHFQDDDGEVTHGRWGVDILRRVHEYAEIGLVLKQGINIKYFAVQEPRFSSGVTLNWIVRAVFDRPLGAFPSTHRYDGYPVILRWSKNIAAELPEALAPFDTRYLGTILRRTSSTEFAVLVRDGSEQIIRGDALFPEPRADVISDLESMLTREIGQQSIQRRILQLSHSLKSDGRRNPGILRDQLRSALKAVDPTGRGEIKIIMRPNCSGTMWLNCYATGAERI
jgi:hypothetical protein